MQGKTDKNIQEFIAGVNSKNAMTWKKIYTDYYSLLCHYAMRILNDQEQAADLVQGAIIKLWEEPLHFENISFFNAYLYRMVYNNCLKIIRDKQREDKQSQAWGRVEDELESESLSAFVFEETIRKLHQAINQMPLKRREVILLTMKK